MKNNSDYIDFNGAFYYTISGYNSYTLNNLKGGNGMSALTSNFEETRNVGNQIKSETESFIQLLEKIKATNEGTQLYWKGESAEKYRQAVMEQAKNMDELAETLNSVGAFIVSAANLLEETETNNANSISIS